LEVRSYGRAYIDFSNALDANDGYIPAYINRAIALKALDRKDEAVDDLRTALLLKPDPERRSKIERLLRELGELAVHHHAPIICSIVLLYDSFLFLSSFRMLSIRLRNSSALAVNCSCK
jgi:tetratricopeptide (TPR) repeat protein